MTVSEQRREPSRFRATSCPCFAVRSAELWRYRRAFESAWASPPAGRSAAQIRSTLRIEQRQLPLQVAGLFNEPFVDFGAQLQQSVYVHVLKIRKARTFLPGHGKTSNDDVEGRFDSRWIDFENR